MPEAELSTMPRAGWLAHIKPFFKPRAPIPPILKLYTSSRIFGCQNVFKNHTDILGGKNQCHLLWVDPTGLSAVKPESCLSNEIKKLKCTASTGITSGSVSLKIFAARDKKKKKKMQVPNLLTQREGCLHPIFNRLLCLTP